MNKLKHTLLCTLSTILNATLTFTLVILIAAILVPCFAIDDGKVRYKRKLKGV